MVAAKDRQLGNYKHKMDLKRTLLPIAFSSFIKLIPEEICISIKSTDISINHHFLVDNRAFMLSFCYHEDVILSLQISKLSTFMPVD
jgi:hypothetical protein